MSDDINKANSIINIVLLVLVITFPPLCAILVHRYRNKLPEMEEQIGSLYLEIRVETRGQRLNSFAFAFRRLSFAVITVFLFR